MTEKLPSAPKTYGPAIRATRIRRGLSSRELAALTGVSQTLISLLENERCGLTVETMRQLSEALDVPPHVLLGQQSTSNGDGEGYVVVRGDSTPSLPYGDSQQAATAAVLAGGGGRLMDAAIWTLDDNYSSQHIFKHEGEDFVYVMAGELEIELGGTTTIILGPGDSLNHDGSLPHRWTTTRGKVQALVISSYAGPGVHSIEPPAP